jgi:hypothetical protein
VTKALRSFHAVAPNPDRDLADARAAIDRGDERTALKRLDKARRGYARRHGAAGLEHLFILAGVLEAQDERARIGRENLVYAVKQNLRLESRRRANMAGEPWRDPYPDLAAPTEHTGIAIGRGLKLVIGAATLLGALAIVGGVVVVALTGTSSTDTTLRLVNDTGQAVQVRGCDDTSCDTTWMHADLDRGLSTERHVPVDDLVDLFQVKLPGGERSCLPLRVHDAFLRGGSDASLVLVAKLSQATPCPGHTVLPRAVSETGL